MNKDTVVGILGAVILVAAMVAIFYYEGTQAPTGTGTPGGAGLYRIANATGPGADGAALGEGASEEASVDIQRQNLTRAVFTVSWTDDIQGQNGPNDEFEVTVTSPSGASQTQRGTGSPLTLTFDGINPVPTQAGVTGNNGTGTWTVLVALLSAGDGAPVDSPVPVPIPGVTDAGNTWALETSLTYYERNA